LKDEEMDKIQKQVDKEWLKLKSLVGMAGEKKPVPVPAQVEGRAQRAERKGQSAKGKAQRAKRQGLKTSGTKTTPTRRPRKKSKKVSRRGKK
jgi:hypothetical protein